jgi:O-antigen/teichoic acid export membrane protein
MKYGVKFAVAGALLGVAASELVTLVVMFISYFACRGKFVAVKLKEEKDTVSRLKDLAAPLILCGMILPTSQFLDSVLIVNLLKLNGSADPTALYGLWSGIVTPLVNLPVMVCLSLGVAVTPQMGRGKRKARRRIRHSQGEHGNQAYVSHVRAVRLHLSFYGARYNKRSVSDAFSGKA